MTMRLSLIINGDATGAAKAANTAAAAIENVGKASVAGTRAIEAQSSAMSSRWQQAAGAAGVASQAFKLNSFQMQNMAFQMNDMATMLASGQSPFVMLMQQGMQISQIFGPGVGVAAALKGVGAALLSFVTNPLNLAVLAFAAAGGAASLLFRTIAGGSESASDALQRHEDLVKAVREQYQLAGGAAEDWGKKIAGVTLLQAQQDLDTQQRNFAAARGALAQSSLDFRGQVVGRPYAEELQALFNLNQQAARGAITIEAYRAKLDAIGTASSYEPVRRYAVQLQNASDNALAFSGRVQDAQKAIDALNGTMQKASGMDSLRAQLAGVSGQMSKGLQSRFEDAFTPRKSQDVPAPAKIGPPISLVDFGAATSAVSALNEKLSVGRDLVSGFVGGLRADAKAGVSAIDALGNAFGRLGDRLLDMALDQAIDGLFAKLAGSSSYMGGSILGGVGSAATGYAWGGLNAAGGMLRGPGTGTSDSIVARVSNGEFIVNAAATARHRPMLEAINNYPPLQRFADGGYVGADAAFGSGSARGGPPWKLEIVNESGSPVKDGGVRNEGGVNIQRIVIAAVTEDIQSGGSLARTIEGTYNMRRRTR
ncbi:MAG: phage tail length tape measure family protein [Bauldia sp.]